MLWCREGATARAAILYRIRHRNRNLVYSLVICTCPLYSSSADKSMFTFYICRQIRLTSSSGQELRRRDVPMSGGVVASRARIGEMSESVSRAWAICHGNKSFQSRVEALNAAYHYNRRCSRRSYTTINEIITGGSNMIHHSSSPRIITRRIITTDLHRRLKKDLLFQGSL